MSKLKYASLVFVSGNREKHREYRSLLGLSDLKLALVDVYEPQMFNLHTLVQKKLEMIQAQIPGDPFFVEHTALVIDAWKGLPGGLIKSFMDTVGNAGICKMMKAYKGAERIASAQVVIGFYHISSGIKLFEGDVPGTIPAEPRGSNNFGWDPIFIPDGSTKTYGEMTLAEKNETSMRKRAAEKFAKFLNQNFEL